MIVYIVVGPGGFDAAWDDPDKAIDAKLKHPSTRAHIIVRQVNSEVVTPESALADAELRRKERERGRPGS